MTTRITVNPSLTPTGTSIINVVPSFVNWNPLSVTDCIIWLDPSDISQLTYALSNVSAIVDKSFTANTFSQTTDSLRPNTSVLFNGIRALTFPRTATANCLSANNSANYNNMTQYSIFIINRPTWLTSTGAAPAMFGIRSATTTAFSWHLDPNKSSYLIWNGSTVASTSFTAQANELLLFGCVQGATTFIPYKNGTAGNTVTYSITAATGLPATYGNSRTGTNEGWQGQIGEVLLYKRALSTTERQRVEGYLAWKWGLQDKLSGTHPYKTVAPIFSGISIPPTAKMSFTV